MSLMEHIEKDVRDLIALHKASMALSLIKAAITPGALDGGGKLRPARGLPGGSGINPKAAPKTHEYKTTKGDDAGDDAVKMFVPILKLAGEKQEITGVVLQPEIVDAQGDIISAEVIEKAAGDFLSGFNVNKALGLMHKDFKQRFELRQSFIAPTDMTIGNKIVKAGSWIMVVKVNDAAIWKKIKDGELTGFSIGGKAKVQKLAA